EYLRKAVREARERSSWVNPDEAFESALDRYVEAVLDPQRSERIIREVHAFARRVAPLGRWISLSRTLLQVAGPGIPDVYQGDELWNLTLVDPDNRGPVDFVHRAAMLGAMEREWGTGGDGRESLLRGMLARPADGRLKMHVLRRTLEARASNRETFVSGNHMKLGPAGRFADAVVSFARESSAEAGFAAVVVATRLPHLVVGTHPDTPPPTGEAWERTAIELPSRLHGRTWRCALTGREFQGNLLPISTVLHTLPLALLLTSGAKPA